MSIYVKESENVCKLTHTSNYLSDDWVQLATVGTYQSASVIKSVPNLNQFKFLILYCNYVSGYYANPVIVTLKLFKNMTWIISDRRDQDKNYYVLCHYISDTQIQFVSLNSDGALYGTK